MQSCSLWNLTCFKRGGGEQEVVASAHRAVIIPTPIRDVSALHARFAGQVLHLCEHTVQNDLLCHQFTSASNPWTLVDLNLVDCASAETLAWLADPQGH
mmetsp:Transcript_29591/g.46388  ORF Transcript_29591/g.46388 Transcript_29591/m.46388 type:complete len:99 (-) Transcript_29591:92-388(-)